MFLITQSRFKFYVPTDQPVKIEFSEKKIQSTLVQKKTVSRGQYKYFVHAFTAKIMLTRKQRRDKS